MERMSVTNTRGKVEGSESKQKGMRKENVTEKPAAKKKVIRRVVSALLTSSLVTLPAVGGHVNGTKDPFSTFGQNSKVRNL